MKRRRDLELDAEDVWTATVWALAVDAAAVEEMTLDEVGERTESAACQLLNLSAASPTGTVRGAA